MATATADTISIIDALRDPQLLGAFLGDDLTTWRRWMVALRCLYGLPVTGPKSRALVQECTGRPAESMPAEGFTEALFLVGRRSGKSRIAACIGAFEAALGGHESKLAKGEKGIVPVIAPTRAQATIVHGYLRAIFTGPVLRHEVVNETRDGFELRNGISVQVLTGDWRHVRGFTLVAAIIDEAAFFGLSEESKVRSDAELVRAIRPGLATIGGRLLAISSPYAAKGHCFNTHRRHHGNADGSVLVWNAPSRRMNPTLPQSVVDAALADDLQAAKAEYLAEFRDDVGIFLPREVIEGLVVSGRKELPPMSAAKNGRRIDYFSFCDLSGGRADDAGLAVAHREDEKVVLDLLRRWRPPFNPHVVIRDMAELLRRYGIRRVTADNYAAEFVTQAFASCGIACVRCDVPKSQLYVELIPRLCSAQVELLDDPVAINQLAGLERRTRSGGKDVIDHPPGTHDDLANCVAGVVRVGHRVITLGAPLQRADAGSGGWRVGISSL